MRYDRRVARIALAVLLGLLVVACGDGESVPTAPTGSTPPGADATATPAGEATATPPGATAEPATPAEDGTPEPNATPAADTACTRKDTVAPVIAACEALAELFERGLDEIDTVSVTPQEWPDACLGLAGSEEVCAQVITPGFVVVLVLLDQGFTYTYRTDDGTQIRLQEFDLSPD